MNLSNARITEDPAYNNQVKTHHHCKHNFLKYTYLLTKYNSNGESLSQSKHFE